MPFSSSSSTRKGLQGPKPPPLRVDRSSIPTLKQQRPSSSSSSSRQHSPVVVHVLSPKVVHTSPQEFMSTVQRLTGKSSPSSPPDPRPLEDTVAISDATMTPIEKTEGLRNTPTFHQFFI